MSVGRPAWRFLVALAVGAASIVLPLALHPRPAAAASWAPSYDQDFPDPSVLVSGGSYFAYSTQTFLASVPGATSTDGIRWNTNTANILPALPPWASFGYTWAPSVAQDAAGQFVMYYAAHDDTLGTECLGRATASSADGPFVDTSSAPVLCQSTLGGSIDPDIFTDAQGQSYLLWKSDGNRDGQATHLWSEPMDADFDLEGSPTLLMSADQGWQGGIVEGPNLLEVQGAYYLFYSGNLYSTARYAVGFATCASPLGPCTDSPDNPVLTTTTGMSGPGGVSLFTALDGQLTMAFAAWPGAIGYAVGGYRAMYLADVSFEGGLPVFDPALDPPGGDGYWEAGADGGVFAFGAPFEGSAGGQHLAAPVVAITAPPGGHGYWLAAADGGVFAYGGAPYLGSMAGRALASPIVGMAATPDGGGYWLVAADGGVFAFGDASFFGSMGGSHLNSPIVGVAPDSGTGGYWLVGADGGVFAFHAPYVGSTGGRKLTRSIVGMAATADGGGYWLVGADGGVFSFGDAPFDGSMGAKVLNAPVIGMAATADGGGYWLMGADGGVFSFGDAPFDGSMGATVLDGPMVAVAAVPATS